MDSITKMPSPNVRRLLAEQIDQYALNAKRHGAIEDYLARRKLAGAERFKLGWTGDRVSQVIRRRLAIPYLTPAGPWHIKYRCIEHGFGSMRPDDKCTELGHPKYVYAGGQTQHLFNARALLHASRVWVVEGELDAIALELSGIPAVGYPGAKAWHTSSWALCFDNAAEVTVLADGDDVGRKAAKTVAQSIREAISGTVLVKYLPDNEDANSLLVREGPIGLWERVGF